MQERHHNGNDGLILSLPWFRWLRSMAREECELGRALEVV
jgi:hypothetical protein